METKMDTEITCWRQTVTMVCGARCSYRWGCVCFRRWISQFNHTIRPDNHNRQRHSLWGPATCPCLINFGGVRGWKKSLELSDVLCRTIIDREGRGTVSCFQYNTFDFYQEQSSVTETILVHCGIVVPPIYSTRSWQTFAELCCLIWQQYFASKTLQRRYHCFKR